MPLKGHHKPISGFSRQRKIALGTWYMARKLHTVGFECPTLATNSLFMDSRKLFERFSLLIVLEGLRQDDKQTQPHEQLPGTQGQEDSFRRRVLILRKTPPYNRNKVKLRRRVLRRRVLRRRVFCRRVWDPGLRC